MTNRNKIVDLILNKTFAIVGFENPAYATNTFPMVAKEVELLGGIWGGQKECSLLLIGVSREYAEQCAKAHGQEAFIYASNGNYELYGIDSEGGILIKESNSVDFDIKESNNKSVIETIDGPLSFRFNF